MDSATLVWREARVEGRAVLEPAGTRSCRWRDRPTPSTRSERRRRLNVSPTPRSRATPPARSCASHTSTRLPAVARIAAQLSPPIPLPTTTASQSSVVAAPLVALVAVMRRVVGVPLAAFMRRVVVACRAAAHCRLQRTTAVRIAAIGCCASQAAYQRTVRDTSLYLLVQ